MGVVPACMDEVGTTKHNWLAWCQYILTGWVSMWAYDIPVRQHYKEGIESHCYNKAPHLIDLITQVQTCSPLRLTTSNLVFAVKMTLADGMA